MTSIRKNLQLGLLLVIAFFVLQIGVYFFTETSIQTNLGTIVKTNTQVASKISTLAINAQQIRRYEKEYFIYVTNIEKRNGYVAEWTEAVQKAERLLQELEENKQALLSVTEIRNVTDWKQSLAFYRSEMLKIFTLVNTQNSAENIALQNAPAPAAKPAKGQAAAAPVVPVLLSPSEVNAMIGPGKDKLSSVLIKGVADMEKTKVDETLSLSGVVDRGFDRMTYIFLAISAVGIVLVLVLLVTLPKTISNAITRLSNSVDKLSKGNIDEAIETGKVSEFAPLAAGLERLRIAQRLLVARYKA